MQQRLSAALVTDCCACASAYRTLTFAQQCISALLEVEVLGRNGHHKPQHDHLHHAVLFYDASCMVHAQAHHLRAAGLGI